MNMKVRPKKHLGQHFLTNEEIADNIAAVTDPWDTENLIEIGPGTGVLTKRLLHKFGSKLHAVEIDRESVKYLKQAEWAKELKLTEGDFLGMSDLSILQKPNTGIIGNYPYNISTQIAFKVIENRDWVKYFGGMFQLEVAKRFCAPHGNKEYGITSVLLQAYFDCKYLFTVEPNAFNPPPKVQSGVMACQRKETQPDCDYETLRTLVKTAFNQRRKTLHNALKPLNLLDRNIAIPPEFIGKRAEQLSVQDFIALAQLINSQKD